LKIQKLLECSEIIAEVESAGGLDAGEDSHLEGLRIKY
jgi:hypothetical protein